MKQSIKKFLEFKGKTLLFLAKDGIYWIAIKPVCEVLGVDFIRQKRNISNHRILGSKGSILTLQVPGDQARQFFCLPEKYIYGWIFSINRNSTTLIEYQEECYEAMFTFFHGGITGREELIRQKAIAKRDLETLDMKLSELEDYRRAGELRAQVARIGKSMKEIENEELKNQYDLFNQS